MLYSNNFNGLLAAFCLLGFFMLPMLPAVVENCAECTYPLPEELSIGLLFFGKFYIFLYFYIYLYIILFLFINL